MMTEETNKLREFKPLIYDLSKRRTDTSGYYIVFCPDHPSVSKSYPYMKEQRVVMENHLGRYLTDDEVVHHDNENKRDNRIENLVLMKKGEHIRHHKIGNKNCLGKQNTLGKILVDVSERFCFICGSKVTTVKKPNGTNKTPRPRWHHLPWDKENWYCDKCYQNEMKK